MIKKYLKHLEFINNPYVIYKIIRGMVKARIFRQNVLRSIELAVTYRCNAQCSICYAKDLHNRERKELSVDEIRNMWKDAQKLGAFMVNLTGGEPTLREDIHEIIKALNPKKNLIYLVTNASLLTEEKIIAFKKSGLSAFQISLDSVSANEHDKGRAIPNLYDNVIESVKLCKKHKMGVCFSSQYWHGDLDSLLKIAELAKKLDIFVLMNYPGIVGGLKDDQSKALSKEELDLSFMLIKHHPSIRCHIMFNFAGNMLCPAGFEKIYITAYGDVMPCIKLQESWGNIRTEKLESLWGKFLGDKETTRKTKYCKRLVKNEKD